MTASDPVDRELRFLAIIFNIGLVACLVGAVTTLIAVVIGVVWLAQHVSFS